MASISDSDVSKSFNWLRRENRGPTYISLSDFSDNPACSFDFGHNGHAASCSYGGGLLHMSAEGEQGDIIFAHGDFDNTYYSSLSRAQRGHSSKATFGLMIPNAPAPSTKIKGQKPRSSEFKVGEMVERGCFNYRWPFNEYTLLLNDSDESEPKETGICAHVSFVKDNVLYQVIRIEGGCRPEADACYLASWKGQVALSIGGSVKFNSFSTDSKAGKVKGYGTPFSNPPRIVDKTNHVQLEVRIHQQRDGQYELLNLKQLDGEDPRGPFYAYAKLCEPNQVRVTDRQTVFVAELRLQRTGPSKPWPKIPTSDEIYDYLGLDSDSEKATGPMWESIFQRREEETVYFSELPEVNLIGRSLEKILTVDLVPTTVFRGKQATDEERPLALVSNLFLRPSIDLQALFWKVRYLVNAYLFLSSYQDGPLQNSTLRPSTNKGTGEENPPSPQVVQSNVPPTQMNRHNTSLTHRQTSVSREQIEFQKRRLQNRIERITTYLVRAFIQPNTQNDLPRLALKFWNPDYYYVMITVWYVVMKCEPFGFEWGWVDGVENWATSHKNGDIANDSGDGGRCLLDDCLRPDDLLSEGREKEKVTLLKWYHYASILKLSQMEGGPFLPETWRNRSNDRKLQIMERNARRAAAAKLSSDDPFYAEDEILDRLGLLAASLGIESLGHQTNSVTPVTVRRILNYDFTRYLTPGRLSVGEKGSARGPWEIYVLCHQDQLSAKSHFYTPADCGEKEETAKSIEIIRRRISHFLNAEACLVPCWERTNHASFKSEATAVLASTLLRIFEQDLEWASEVPKNTGAVSQRIRTDLANAGSDPRPTADSRRPSLTTDRMLSLELGKRTGPSPMKGFLVGPERLENCDTEIPPAIEWKQYRPPRKYHSSSFFNSIDDTPHAFNNAEIMDRIDTFVSRRGEAQGKPNSPLVLNRNSVRQLLEEYTLAVIDFKVNLPDEQNDYVWQGYDSAPWPSDEDKSISGGLQKLSDSLVDQGVQHRTIVLSMPLKDIYNRNLLNLFWQVFHVESADCFITHDSKFPDFSCQKGNTWCTRITLRGWSRSAEARQSTNVNEAPEATSGIRSQAHQLRRKLSNESIVLPDSLKEEPPSDKDQQTKVELRVSSIVLSTNSFGEFSQCTIISEQLYAKRDRIEEQCKSLWEQFVHQPQSARCLVFLAILGLLCQQMATDFEDAMLHFEQMLKVDKSSIFDEDNLLRGRDSLKQLKRNLWSLESLVELHNSLTDSITHIEKASNEMRAQIDEGPGRRGETLEKMCQDSLEEFARNMNQLIVLKARLKQRVDLNNRYKEYLSTVWALQDSRNSIHQNSTVRKLTYLTIGYLPLGLITAIFAIPSDQQVIIPNMGLKGFIVSIVILVFITFVVVILLERILGGFGRLSTARFPLGGGSDPIYPLLEWFKNNMPSRTASRSKVGDVESGSASGSSYSVDTPSESPPRTFRDPKP